MNTSGKFFVGLILSVQLSGCQSITYYSQALNGQVDIWSRQRDIETVLADPAAESELKTRLEAALRARRFASEQLGLPDNGSYSRYADLERDYVVWNVIVTPKFSVEPVQSCFPVVGCVSYRGYYQQLSAQAYADTQRKAGLDVYVGGVSAYSTLGWFDDPLLSTMLGRSDAEIAGLIFHELAHQRVFVKGDTRFNESFATAVEEIGLNQWAKAAGNSEAVNEHFKRRKIQNDVVALLLDVREKLRTAYAENADMAENHLAEIKQAHFDLLRLRYAELKQAGGGSLGFDRFIDSELNNASLAIFGEYHGWVDAFERLYEQNNRNWESFFEAVETLGDLPKTARKHTLDSIQ